MVEQGLLGQIGGMAEAANAATVAVPAGPTPSLAGRPERPIAAAPQMEPSAATAIEPRSPQQRYKDAYPIATQLTGSLGLRGFRLNLSVEGTSSYEELLALAPKIRATVGNDKSVALDRALGL
jgi:hypothetical protein